MEGRETVMDRAARAGRAWESVQATMGPWSARPVC